MTGKVFIDTNFLVYLFGADDLEKQRKCKYLLTEKFAENMVVWSTQVIQEFYSVLVKKLRKSPLEVKKSIMMMNDFQIITNDYDIILSAIDIQVLHQLSFWDSLIVASAASSNCDILLSEDLNDGQIISGVKVVNPFSL